MLVMPAALKELIRHANIGTIMKYYVGQIAHALADAVWAAVGDTCERKENRDKENARKTGGDDRS
jgi:hypothetical protein